MVLPPPQLGPAVCVGLAGVDGEEDEDNDRQVGVVAPLEEKSQLLAEQGRQQHYTFECDDDNSQVPSNPCHSVLGHCKFRSI